MAINRLNVSLSGVQPGGLAKVVPTSVAVGSGSGSVDSNGTVTFSGVSSVSINGVFNSTYDNYFIQIDFTHGSTQDASIKLRKSGTDKSTNYTMTGTRLNGTTVDNYGTGTTSFFYTMQVTNNNIGFTNLHIARPAISGRTTLMADSVGEVAGQRYITSGIQTETETYDGFTFICGTATTGKIKVYGYAN